MKTLHFVHLLNDYSGSPRVLGQTITALQQRGADCTLHVGSNGHGVLNEVNVRTCKFAYKRFDNRWLTLLAYAASQVALFFSLVRRVQPGSVVWINTMLPFGAALAARLRGAKVVYHVHETSIRPALLKAFLRQMIARCANKTIYVSKYLQVQEGVPGVPAVTVYNGLTEGFQQQAMATPYQSLHGDCFNVLMLGSLKGYKGVEEFVALACALADDPILKFTLVLNASPQEVETYFLGRALPANLELSPTSTEVQKFYREASLVLNLSHVDGWVETFGLTILEAMAFGIPTIVPPVGGPVELVSDGVEGYQIDSKNHSQLVRTVTRLSQDPLACQALSERARRKASEFSAAHFQRNIMMVFDDL